MSGCTTFAPESKPGSAMSKSQPDKGQVDIFHRLSTVDALTNQERAQIVACRLEGKANPGARGRVEVEVRRGSYSCTISLQCTLCRYQFRSPKILPCYHTFCEACLYAVVQHLEKTPQGTKLFPCPTCRAKTEMPIEGVSGLQTNYVLAAQVIRLLMDQKRPECCVCAVRRKATQEPTYATLKCWECDKFLCNKCLEIHKALLKFHTLIHLSQTGPFKVARYTFCSKHPDEHLRFYCLRCDDTICRDCRLTSHAEGHKTMDMADLQTQAKELISKVNEVVLDSFVPVMEASCQFLSQEYEQMKAMRPKLEAAIKERERVLLKAVQDAAQQTLQQLDDALKQSEEASRSYQDALSRMRSEAEFNELVIECGCEADVMQAAMNSMRYKNKKSTQACRVSVMDTKHDLQWEKQDHLRLVRPDAPKNEFWKGPMLGDGSGGPDTSADLDTSRSPETSVVQKEFLKTPGDGLKGLGDGSKSLLNKSRSRSRGPEDSLKVTIGGPGSSLKLGQSPNTSQALRSKEPSRVALNTYPKVDANAQKSNFRTTMNLKDFKDYAEVYLGRVFIAPSKFTLSCNQAGEQNHIHKCFRKIGLMVDNYKKTYEHVVNQ